MEAVLQALAALRISRRRVPIDTARATLVPFLRVAALAIVGYSGLPEGSSIDSPGPGCS